MCDVCSVNDCTCEHQVHGLMLLVGVIVLLIWRTRFLPFEMCRLLETLCCGPWWFESKCPLPGSTYWQVQTAIRVWPLIDSLISSGLLEFLFSFKIIWLTMIWIRPVGRGQFLLLFKERFIFSLVNIILSSWYDGRWVERKHQSALYTVKWYINVWYQIKIDGIGTSKTPVKSCYSKVKVRWVCILWAHTSWEAAQGTLTST